MPSPDPQTSHKRPWLHAAALLALLVAAGVFVWRGACRGPEEATDIMTIYTASRAWANGANPYDYAQLEQTARHAGYTESYLPNARTLPSLYPPTTFVLFWPLTRLDYPTARVVWMAVNLLFTVLLIWRLIVLAGPRVSTNPGAATLLAAAALALAPLQNCLALGQSAIAAVLLLVIGAQWAMTPSQGGARHSGEPVESGGVGSGLPEHPRLGLRLSRRLTWSWYEIGAGAAAGLAVALKPQLGGVLLLYLLLRLHKGLLVALVVMAGLLAIGDYPLRHHGIHWTTNLARNLHAFSFGGVGDPTAANPNLDQLINLHHPLHVFLDNRNTVDLLVLGLASAIVAVAWVARYRPRINPRICPRISPRRELLFLSILAVASLWAVTHRFYDCVLLVLPLAWLAGELAPRIVPPLPSEGEGAPISLGRVRAPSSHPLLWFCAAALAVFLVNTTGVLVLLHAYHPDLIPDSLTASRWWTAVILPHQTWVLLALTLALGYTLSRSPTAPADPA